MGTWTDWQLSEGNGEGDWMQEGEGISQEHICMTHRQTAVWSWPEGSGGWMEEEKRGEDGDICNSVNHKNKTKQKTNQKSVS